MALTVMIIAMCKKIIFAIVKSPEGKSNIGRSWLAIKLMVLPRLSLVLSRVIV